MYESEERMAQEKLTAAQLREELTAAKRRIIELESRLESSDREAFPGKSRDFDGPSKSADYLRSLIRTIPDLVWLKDSDGAYLTCNSVFERFFGATEREIVGKTDYDFVSKDQANFFRERDRRAMEAGKPTLNEEWLTFSDNGYRGLFETIKTPMRDAAGNFIGVLGIARDITDRKRAEEALEKRMVALTRPLDDAYGITFDDLFNLEDIQRLQDEFALATGVASIITRPDGEPITTPSNFCRLCNDLIRKTEAGLANCFKSDAQLGRLSDKGPTIRPCMNGGLWDAGAGISVGGRHIASWLIGQVRDGAQNEDKVRAYARKIGADEDAMAEAFREVPAMSRERFGRVSQALYTLANQLSAIAYQNVQQARFISELKRAEEELIEMKDRAEAASRVKSEFLANMSHEIRTPLNGALSMLQVLESTPLGSEQAEYLRAAMTSAKRLTSLLSDILDISRIEAGKVRIEKKEFIFQGIEDSILDLFGQAARERGNRLEFTAPENAPRILIGDEARLRQILFNLVGNAVKFTENGLVRVEATVLPRFNRPDVTVLFTVSDTGIGIADDQLKDIFEPFVQAEGAYAKRFQGAGLGLSIVKKLVGLMDGALAIDNGPGQGVAFYLSLPFHVPEGGERQASPPQMKTRPDFRGGYDILLVEDEVVSAMACRLMLEKDGHRVVSVGNGLEAIQNVSEGRFDLVFMDIQMPIMDGVEATRKIRSSNELGPKSKIPIIAMTAYTMSGDREKFLEAGMDDYIPKPIGRDDMIAVIKRVMKKADHEAR